ncbi:MULTISPECIES: hypothetical protein [Mesorhizobium]|uniref:Uncharacterized protein n=1 Tax=Mesorhizobium ciceri TaxID=39645 RepID=A0AB38TKI3_9HYPH|nr:MULTISPECIES: hypothetical protein [Mesorhizobium]MDF3213346.1 hypothetical protein [Mesorhizobium ciceri]UTU55002.1 hypothetical protein LRP29_03480 [Mesorhizobium ciceri]
MQAEIVTVVEFACRQWLVSASQEQRELDFIKLSLVADVQQVNEHRRAGVAQRIELSGVDQRLFLLADSSLMSERRSSPDSPCRTPRASNFAMRGDKAMPSTALIFSPRSLVSTNWPVLAERLARELGDFISRQYHNH